MDDGRDLPPLPIRPPEGPVAPVAESSRRHSHRSKDRNSARDLATLLLLEQREHRETQRELSRVTEELRIANLRAEEAESRVELAKGRLRSVNQARLSAVAEAARANESLGLYKFQLETAQHEIHRAQSVFNIVEKERYEAELAGAKSRTAARKLYEQHKIIVAREQGRREGLQEGLEAGRLNLFSDQLGGVPATSDSQMDDYGDYEFYSPGDYAEELYDPSPPRNADSILPRTTTRDTSAPVPIPPPSMPIPTPVPDPAVPLSPLQVFVPLHDIHPTPVHNEAPHPRHEHIDVPPDGYIPSTGPDSLPQVPPPHEFSRQRDPSPSRANGSVAGGSIMSPRQDNHHHNATTSQRAYSVRAPSIMSPRQSNHQHNPISSERAPSVRAPSVRAPSVRAESVRPGGSVRPVQMPTPRTNPNILEMEQQALRSSWASGSDFYGGGLPAQTAHSAGHSSGPIPISVMPPSEPQSHASSGHILSPLIGNNSFGPGIGTPNPRSGARSSPLPSIYTSGTPVPGVLPSGFVHSGSEANQDSNAPPGASPMPGGYDLPHEEGVYDPFRPSSSLSTHSSDFQESEPDTLTTPPETRRPHPHKPPRVGNPKKWPGYSRTPETSTPGPGFGYDETQGSTSRT